MPPNQQTTQNSSSANAQQAERQREEAIQKLSLWGRFKNFLARLFGRGRDDDPQEKKEENKPQVKEEAAFIDAWDSLTDDSNALKQKFDQTLSDLANSRPAELEGSEASDPKAVEAYRQSLEEFQTKLTAAEDSYSKEVTELQQRRDGLLGQGIASQVDIDTAALDAPLGTAGEGPGHHWFKMLNNEANEIFEELDAKAEQSKLETPGVEGMEMDAPESAHGDDIGIIRSEAERRAVVVEVTNLLKESVAAEQTTGVLSIDLEQVQAITDKLSAPDNLEEFSVRDQLHASRNSATMAAIYDGISDLQEGRMNVRDVLDYAGGSFTKSPTSEMVNRFSEKGQMEDPAGFKEDMDNEKNHIKKTIERIEKDNVPATPQPTPDTISM